MSDPISKEKLAEILSLHGKWRVSGGSEGSRADLSGADLRGAQGILRLSSCDGYDVVLVDWEEDGPRTKPVAGGSPLRRLRSTGGIYLGTIVQTQPGTARSC